MFEPDDTVIRAEVTLLEIEPAISRTPELDDEGYGRGRTIEATGI